MNSSNLNIFQSSETDMNRDGRNDKLDFELTMPLTEDENVYGIKLFVLFDVKLYVSIRIVAFHITWYDMLKIYPQLQMP